MRVNISEAGAFAKYPFHSKLNIGAAVRLDALATEGTIVESYFNGTPQGWYEIWCTVAKANGEIENVRDLHLTPIN